MITQHSTIGFIGLGAMGQRMALRLLTKGFKLVVYDHTSRKIQALAAAGATPAPSVRQLARKSEVIVSCLPTDEAVLSVYQGPEGVIACANPGTVVIEMSTLLGGGDARVFDSCQPIFSAVAKQYFHMGPAGSGTTMKLVVNTLLGVNMQAIAEAVAFGEKAGLGRALLLRVLAKTAVVAAAHQNKLLRAERDDYSPQFPLRLMNKDFGLILEKAAEIGAPMPTTAAAHQIFAARSAANGNEDFSSVIEEMEHQARVRRNSEPVDELSRLAR